LFICPYIPLKILVFFKELIIFYLENYNLPVISMVPEPFLSTFENTSSISKIAYSLPIIFSYALLIKNLKL